MELLVLVVSTAWAQTPVCPVPGAGSLPARLGGPDGPIDRP